MTAKRIVFRFVGGDQDGRVEDSAKQTPEQQAGRSDGIQSLIFMTDNGKLGGTMRLATERFIQAMRDGNLEEIGDSAQLRYKVTERQETDDCVTVTLTCQGAAK